MTPERSLLDTRVRVINSFGMTCKREKTKRVVQVRIGEQDNIIYGNDMHPHVPAPSVTVSEI